MRVLHVLDMSLPRVAGYTSRARAILESQAALGIAPAAVTGLRQGPSEAERETIGGIVHHRTPPPTLLGRVDGVPFGREAVELAAFGRTILTAAREHGSELIHAHSPILCGVPGLAAARRLGVPFAYEIRAFWEDAATDQGRDREGSPRYRAIRAAETALVRQADVTIAICEGIRRDLLARGIAGDRLFVVPNGVDTKRFTPRPRDERLAERLGFQGKTVVAYIGTLFGFEGVGRLLRALRRMIDTDDSVRGLVVGYGETLDALKAEHARLGLGDKVVLTGKVAPSEVEGYYSIADVLCYPREKDRITDLTTPLKPLEAMSMGKAVVGSDVGGIRELVDDRRTGLCFRAGDDEDLARVLGQVVRDRELRRRLGEDARAEMIRSRDWKVLARRYLDIYEVARERAARRLGSKAAVAPRAAANP